MATLVYPHLHPCLNNIYPKIGGKERGDELIYVNNEICADLLWTANRLSNSDGVHFIQSLDWPLNSANLTIYCDTSLTGMGFWLPDDNLGFQSPNPLSFIPRNLPAHEWILPYESLCRVLALQHAAADSLPPESHVMIYTDSSNMVAIFSTLCCLPFYV